MFASITSASLIGIEPEPVRVEVHLGGGKPSLAIVGLPDTAVREARDRVRAAIASSGFHMPDRHITINLAPAALPKVGSAYDLPIALGVLAADGVAGLRSIEVVALGELALDGTVRPARGGLAAGSVAASRGLPCLIAADSAAEAARVPGADVRPVTSLAHAVGVMAGTSQPAPIPADPHEGLEDAPDLSAVRGQPFARRGLELAAAGGHHLLMWGPPGAGKTLLARCLPSILPPLGDTQSLEVARAWAAAGRSDAPRRIPPFRSPHHSATMPALVGGGTGVPTPGEMTLANEGVLFLDELGEFPPRILDAFRQPLEEGHIVVARQGASVRFPARAQLIAATNPCPCGFSGDRKIPCQCSPRAADRYRRRISGPLLDRFDVRVSVGRVSPEDFLAPPSESSAAVRARVLAARKRQDERGRLNRNLTREQLDALDWEEGGLRLAASGLDSDLTARGHDRVRRLARTIADLGESDLVTEAHIAEAMAFRSLW